MPESDKWDGTRQSADRIFEEETTKPQSVRQLTDSLDSWVMRVALADSRRNKSVDTTSERE